METLGQRIKRLREGLNLRPAELARLVGVPPQYIDNWENRGHRPSPRYLGALAEVLGVSEHELLTGRRPDARRYEELSLRELLEQAELAAAALPGYEVRSFPLLGEIAAGAPLEAETADTTTLTTHVPRGTADNCFFLRINGDSMAGDGILTGDLVLIDPNFDPHAVNEDSIYAVQLDEADVTLKRLRRVEDTVWMISSNPRIPPMPLDGERYAQARLLGTVAKLERYY